MKTAAISFETAFRATRRPIADEIDANNHVNNIAYLTWVQAIAIAHWADVADQELMDRRRFVVLQHVIDYQSPLFEYHDVEVSTWLGKVGKVRMERHTDIRIAGASLPAATAVTQWCLINISGGKPVRIDANVLQAFGLR